MTMRFNISTLPAPPVPAATQKWASFLDVDGTLLEFAPTPDTVQVPALLVPLLWGQHLQ